MKLPRQNCVSYKDGNCHHPSAPKLLIGNPSCVLNFPEPKDPRIIRGCALQAQHDRPPPPPPPPKMREIEEGVRVK